MSTWIKKLIGMHTCWHCEKLMNRKDVYSVDVDTLDGPMNFKMCKPCAEDLDDMLKELEETIATRNEIGEL
tara:strand:+ start:4151 stop:4363 length:213 start_codon:yes stop_codon:yes gene_type:complete